MRIEGLIFNDYDKTIFGDYVSPEDMQKKKMKDSLLEVIDNEFEPDVSFDIVEEHKMMARMSVIICNKDKFDDLVNTLEYRGYMDEDIHGLIECIVDDGKKEVGGE